MRAGAILVAKLVAAALIVASCLCAPARAERRVALVVGNSAYKNVTPLDNPKNDAALMADTLRSLGFTLVGGAAQLDLDKSGIDRAVQKFGDLLQGADVGLFYYAGHGVQLRGANYLVPVDANPTRESDVDFQMLDANLILRQMADAGTKLNVVILDACRNNPFGGRGLRDAGGGLAQMQAPEGTLISFATQPGNVARDGADGDSPYTKALAATIRRPGLGIFDTFNEVGLAVMRATGNAQQPWLSTSPITGSFYFAGPAAASSTAAAEQPGMPAKEARLSNPTGALRSDLPNDCDRLAGDSLDKERPSGVVGVLDSRNIDVVPALRACNDAMREYPDVARFVYQAGRVALAQKDYGAARQLLEKAIGMGSNSAVADLGMVYINGWGVTKDYVQGRQWAEQAAAEGEPRALNSLGVLYQFGWGVAQDYGEARRWYEKAAAAGNPTAMSNLGILFQNGWGAAKDYTQARQWFEKAASAGDAGAIADIGFLYQSGLGVTQDYAQARQWYEKGAAANDAASLTGLGLLYENGWGVAQNYAQARQWFEKAADRNHVAMTNLGWIYLNGLGAPKDYVQARQWFDKGVAAGNAMAMNDIGIMYEHAWGVPQDYAQARQWYEKAAAAGNALAMNNMGALYQNGFGVARDYAQARQWYEKAAAAGNAMAMNNLGVVYNNGLGVAKDLQQARQWYEKAAAAGNGLAEENLKRLGGKR